MFAWVVVVLFLGVVGWFWSFLYRGEKPPFRCVGCGKCAAAGECILMREEHERKMRMQAKKLEKKLENHQDPS